MADAVSRGLGRIAVQGPMRADAAVVIRGAKKGEVTTDEQWIRLIVLILAVGLTEKRLVLE